MLPAAVYLFPSLQRIPRVSFLSLLLQHIIPAYIAGKAIRRHGCGLRYIVSRLKDAVIVRLQCKPSFDVDLAGSGFLLILRI